MCWLPISLRVSGRRCWARVVDEAEYADIAVALATSEQAVRQRVSRGLRRLEAALRKEPR